MPKTETSPTKLLAADIRRERDMHALRYHAILRDYRALLIQLYRGTPAVTPRLLSALKGALDDNDLNGAQPWPKR